MAVGATEGPDSTVESDSKDSDREELRDPEEDRTKVDPLKPHGTSWNVQYEININFDQGWHPKLQIAWVAGTPVIDQRTDQFLVVIADHYIFAFRV